MQRNWFETNAESDRAHIPADNKAAHYHETSVACVKYIYFCFVADPSANYWMLSGVIEMLPTLGCQLHRPASSRRRDFLLPAPATLCIVAWNSKLEPLAAELFSFILHSAYYCYYETGFAYGRRLIKCFYKMSHVLFIGILTPINIQVAHLQPETSFVLPSHLLSFQHWVITNKIDSLVRE